MDQLELTRKITVHGNNFLGPATWVELSPTSLQGWFWDDGDVLRPIVPPLVSRKFRQLSLCEPPHSLKLVEHLLALRFAGLDNVVIKASPRGLPYDGSAQAFWNEVMPHTRSVGTLRTVSLRKLPRAIITDRKKAGWVSARPPEGNNEELIIDIHIDYGGPFKGNHAFILSRELFSEVVEARTLGWPRWTRVPAYLLSQCGWPHYDKILWPSANPTSAEIRTVLMHRLLDICGGLASALPPGRMFSGTITSHCAGHGQDILLADAINSSLSQNCR